MKKRKALALIGCDAPNEAVLSLCAEGFEVISLPRHPALTAGVASHADMLFFQCGSLIFTPKAYISDCTEIKNAIDSYGYELAVSEAELSSEYPRDICFNIAKVGKLLLGRSDCFAKEISVLAKNSGLQIVHTKQGYAKCSALVLGEAAIITADSTIAKAAKANGIDVLQIKNSPDSITIEGYDYGFIGGCCGTFENTVYFSGNPYLHPQGECICDFCHKHGFKIQGLTKQKLCDIGGILFLPRLNR